MSIIIVIKCAAESYKHSLTGKNGIVLKVGGKEASFSITLNSLKLMMVEVFKEPRNNESVSFMQQTEAKS